MVKKNIYFSKDKKITLKNTLNNSLIDNIHRQQFQNKRRRLKQKHLNRFFRNFSEQKSQLKQICYYFKKVKDYVRY